MSASRWLAVPLVALSLCAFTVSRNAQAADVDVPAVSVTGQGMDVVVPVTIDPTPSVPRKRAAGIDDVVKPEEREEDRG